jgi:C1A family cysteine protease
VLLIIQNIGLSTLNYVDGKEISDIISIKNVSILKEDLLLTSSFLGGSGFDGMYYTGLNIAQDNQGNIFITGSTESFDFPITSGVFSENNNGNCDIFITKMNQDLSEIIASTYIGGKGIEEARGITIDSEGNIFVCGMTESTDFPVSTNAFQNEYGGSSYSPYGSGDSFIIKMSNDLTDLISSTYLGGRGHESGSSICIDHNGCVVVSGSTSSSDFPVSDDAFDTTYSSGGNLKDDVFITKLSNDLTSMIGSTYISGEQDDFSEAVLVDLSNNIVIAGWTSSSEYPVTNDAYDTSYGRGYYDGFISKLDPNLSHLVSSTFLGGSNWDFCYGLGMDSSDNLMVTGHTASSNFPTTEDAYCRNYQGKGGQGAGDDVFVSKLSNNLSCLKASTYLGGDDWENGFSILVTDNDMVYVAGTTTSADFPVKNSYSDSYHGGSTHRGDAFITCLTPELSRLPASTYLGGMVDDEADQMICDIEGNIIVTGSTMSEDFPTVEDSLDSSFNGDADVFISSFPAGLCENSAPNKPTLDGPASGKIDELLEFSASSVDSNDDDVWFLFNWGDGTNSEWIGPFNSGEICNLNHTWTEKDEYTIKVKARDVFGLESEWSDPLTITLAKNKIIDVLLNYIRSHFPQICIFFETNTNKIRKEKDQQYVVMSDPLIAPTFEKQNDEPKYQNVDLPNNFSWKNYDGQDFTTPAKDQGNCGSCWDFAAMGTLEAMINIQHGDPTIDIDLSEQYVLSCLPKAANHYGEGCLGGNPYNAFKYLKDEGEEGNFHNGALPETCFSYYADHRISCDEKCENWVEELIPLEDYGFSWPGFDSTDSRQIIKSKVYEYGPLAVGIDCTNHFINWGTTHHNPEDYYPYIEQEWNNRLNHLVVLVGWKDDDSIPKGGYWICKNSWGTNWGYDGFYNVEYGGMFTGAFISWVSIQMDNENMPPLKPEIPTGPNSGRINREISFSTVTTDPNGDQVHYQFDWGNSNYSEWFGPYESGENVSVTHTWTDKGDFEIKVKAKDMFGFESEWSDPLILSMSKERLDDKIQSHLDKILLRFL